MITRGSLRHAVAVGDFAAATARAGIAGTLAAVVAIFLFPSAGRAQVELTPAERNCSDRYRGYLDYVECLASLMEPIDPAKRDWYGEFYGAKEYLNCALTRPQGDTSCDKHRLKRRLQPEYWPYEGKVPPMKWPEAPKETVYREGMKPKDYFDALCKAEAGEFIYRTVEAVEGIYQIRPRLRAGTYELRDRYVMEDPYGYTDREARNPQGIFVYPGLRYSFLEVPNVAGKKHSEDRIDVLKITRMPDEQIKDRNAERFAKKITRSLESNYGYTWRGIKRTRDRENNIAGGELAVVDLRTNEILGLRRGFIHVQVQGQRDYSVDWDHWYVCPRFGDRRAGKDTGFVYWFLEKVLRPKLTK